MHPFEGADTWEGHGSLIHEIAEDLRGPPPGAIIASVGGGGLALGVLSGLKVELYTAIKPLLSHFATGKFNSSPKYLRAPK